MIIGAPIFMNIINDRFLTNMSINVFKEPSYCPELHSAHFFLSKLERMDYIGRSQENKFGWILHHQPINQFPVFFEKHSN